MDFHKISFLLSFLFLTVVSCESSEDDSQEISDPVPIEEGYVPHPHPDMMPHPDLMPTNLELRDASDYIDSFPESLQLLHQQLNTNSQVSYNEMDLNVSSQFSLHVSSLNENTLIILDQGRNRLIQYDLINHESVDLAPEGRGPGDLLFSREMQLFNNRIYIGMQGFRISIFNCEFIPCQYESTVNTELNNYSISPTHDYISVLGLYPFGREQDPNPDNYDLPSIYQIDYTGNVELSYSSVYRHERPFVREIMNSHGAIRSFPNLGLHILTYDRFPYIYLYDEAGQIEKKYQIPNFKIRYYDYNIEDRSGQNRYINNTTIAYSKKLSDEWVLFQLLNRKDLQPGQRSKEKRWHTYLALNVRNQKLYKIGDDVEYSIGNGRSIYATTRGLLINQGGETLYWVSTF